MIFSRSSGILLHPTSLPGPYGIGDLGPEAYRFAEFLTAAGQKLWQVLPLGPTGYGDSPYQCFSAFAGNPMLLSPDKLIADGWLERGDMEPLPEFPRETVSFEEVIPYKTNLLRLAYRRFSGRAGASARSEFARFCREQSSWLDGYSEFMALKAANGGEAVWTEWEPGLKPDAAEVETRKFWQFLFFRQWGELKAYCAQRGITVMGDMPIYVAHDSADVWEHREMFQLDERGQPIVVAGVPPDYFSATGQLWGNPIYRWDVLAETGFEWWVNRFRQTLSLIDRVRLDHFRGFEAYWQVRASEETAINGEWLPGPGAELFEVLGDSLGELPIVAENLGVITPPVEELRARFGFPGMAILQFAFGNDPQAPTFRPHNYPRELVAYTGTHDNNTTVGWWTSRGTADSTRSPEEVERERAFTRSYLGISPDDAIHWAFTRALLVSVADTVIIPLQDVLGLGSEARMNLPGRPAGNWRWRVAPGQITTEIAERLRTLCEAYDR